MVVAEVVADDERRRHVDEARADAVEQAVRQEQPLRPLDERRPDAAESEHAGAEQAAGTVAVAAGAHRTYEADRQRRARQRHAERQRSDPVYR